MERVHGQYVLSPVVKLGQADLEAFSETGTPTLLFGGRVFLLTSLVERQVTLRVADRAEAEGVVQQVESQLERIQRAVSDPAEAERTRSTGTVRKAHSQIAPPAPQRRPTALSRALHKALCVVTPRVFGEYGVTLEPCAEGAHSERCAESAPEVGAFVLLDGAVSVAVGLAATAEAARRIHLLMTEEDLPAGDPEHSATLGELVNMITGATAGAINMRGVQARGQPAAGILGSEAMGSSPVEHAFCGEFGSVRLLCAARKAGVEAA